MIYFKYVFTVFRTNGQLTMILLRKDFYCLILNFISPEILCTSYSTWLKIIRLTLSAYSFKFNKTSICIVVEKTEHAREAHFLYKHQ